MRVRGVALGRFAMASGPADDPVVVAHMLANFAPDTVPILSRHGGLLVGYLDSLTADRSDLHFTGSVIDDPDLIPRLRSGLAVSIETEEPLWPRWDGRPHPDATAVPLAVTRPYFRGQLGLGRNLVGVALLLNGERPAARGSVIWLE